MTAHLACGTPAELPSTRPPRSDFRRGAATGLRTETRPRVSSAPHAIAQRTDRGGTTAPGPATDGRPIRVVVVGAAGADAEELLMVLRDARSLELVSFVDHESDDLSEAAAARPDVVVVDHLPLPEELRRWLAAERHGAVALVVRPCAERHRRDEDVVHAIRAAAAGYVIRAAAAGSTRPPRDVRIGRESPDTPSCSPREREVLAVLAEGATNAEIGSRLMISDATVRSHVQNLRGKLGARSRAELVLRAYGMGLGPFA